MDHLRIVQNQAKILPIAQTTEDADLQTIQMLVYEPLIRWDRGRMLPGLAESWDISADGRTWHFHLREEARFSDGSLCTVEDVMRTFELLRVSSDPFLMPGPYAPYMQSFVEHPIGKYDFNIHSIEPNGDVADILSEVFIRKQDVRGMPTLGTGKYKIVEYENDDFVRLAVRKDNQTSLYPQITFTKIQDSLERYEELLQGRADLAVNLEQLEDIPLDNPFRWGRIGNTLTVPIFLNGFNAPFNQPEARLAINLAIDTRQIIRDVWHGLAIPASTVVSPYHYGYPATLQPMAYRPSQAKDLFSKVEMPSELILRTPLIIPDRAKQVCENIAHQLSNVGLKIKIDVVEDRTKFAREVGAQRIGHMAIFDSSPHSTYRILREKVSSRAKWMWWQGVVDEQVDTLISKAHATYQPEERKRAYENTLTYLNQAPVWLYLYHPISVYAYREEVTGVEMSHTGLLRIPEFEKEE